jgi:hypothetical protein
VALGIEIRSTSERGELCTPSSGADQARNILP